VPHKVTAKVEHCRSANRREEFVAVRRVLLPIKETNFYSYYQGKPAH